MKGIIYSVTKHLCIVKDKKDEDVFVFYITKTCPCNIQRFFKL